MVVSIVTPFLASVSRGALASSTTWRTLPQPTEFFSIMFAIGDELPAIVWLDILVLATVPRIDNAVQVCASCCVPRQARGVLVPAIMVKYLVNS